ncbi:SMODS domain-containing nucleotidyltransferase [Ralstonia syzygii]|uniref:SMODS domain-containing nucleotidyltransferase n=1 Tax=Ralstonia syzygii TaxID=28097 RepID=UPI0018D11272
MKLLEHFKTFLEDHVNLNQTRIDQLSDSVEAVKAAIRESEWGPEIIQFATQGSWAHGTIIKPLPDKEFDADLLVFVKTVAGWEAKDYINKLHAALEKNATYKDKLRRYSHCVTIEYSGERRIDIAPVVRGRVSADQDEVCNRNSNEFESSAPTAYTDWVIKKNAIVGGNDLKKSRDCSNICVTSRAISRAPRSSSPHCSATRLTTVIKILRNSSTHQLR